MFEGIRARLEGVNFDKRFYIALASVVIVLFVASAAALLMSPSANRTNIPMDKDACESSGGIWNECGSPCMGAPQGTICILVCRQQCEWYAGNAAVAKNSAYAAQDGFGCLTQDNGILMCWMAADILA